MVTDLERRQAADQLFKFLRDKPRNAPYIKDRNDLYYKDELVPIRTSQLFRILDILDAARIPEPLKDSEKYLVEDDGPDIDDILGPSVIGDW